MQRLVDIPDYRRFWGAAAISVFGSYVTLLALQIMVLELMDGTAFDLGILNAARWLPYLLFGVLAGAFIDRWRRKPVLVATDFGRAAVLCVIPILYAVDSLTIAVLAALMAVFGAMSLLFDGANQSFLPRLVPHGMLAPANARLEQTGAVAESTAPLLAGALVKAVGAPVAILIDAASYVVSGFLLLSVRVKEVARPVEGRRNLRAEMREGLSWVYKHRTLAAAAWTSHLWFLFMSMLGTVFPAFWLADDGLGFDVLSLGAVYACGGVGAVLGGALAGELGRRFDVGRTVVVTRATMPFAWMLVPFAGSGTGAFVTVAVAQFLFWVAMGIEGPIEMAYRQSITPDALQGRTNTTIRSFNRAAVVVGAPVGGFVAVASGHRVALWIGIAGFAVAAIALALSSFRHASYDDAASMHAPQITQRDVG